ncbi:alcohol dehydrogenase catalytic domain-containing protein [Nocardia jiangxiensis]|uniref:Alcohol dehydrogenase catalytic domain-containing protein n=1 Tax=Nocardia jiangxiensis TaxID=282685 RepID=A0ABW6RYP6_9NOCA
MKAVVLRHGDLVVTDIPEPPLGPGQLLVQPLAVGICGSDLSARQHTGEFLAAHREAGVDGALFDSGRDVVFGHELTGRVVRVGVGVTDFHPGQNLVILPMVIGTDGVMHTLGYANDYPGGLAERIVVQAYGHLPIPDSVSPYLAAVTEPMATGLNAVLRSGIQAGAAAVVTGCGPVGLGAVVDLAYRGIHPIIASDPSAQRREIAKAYGADIVVDPAQQDPLTVYRDQTATARELFVFEASAASGLLDRLMAAVPPFTRILVVGAGMTRESIRTVTGVLKNVSIEFVGGPGKNEDRYIALDQMFAHLVEGRFDPAAMVTGYAGLDSVAEVFDALRPRNAAAIEHVKILVRPDVTQRGIVPNSL